MTYIITPAQYWTLVCTIAAIAAKHTMRPTTDGFDFDSGFNQPHRFGGYICSNRIHVARTTSTGVKRCDFYLATHPAVSGQSLED